MSATAFPHETGERLSVLLGHAHGVPGRDFRIRDLLTAAEDCHARGIIHRDIKPSNIIVAANGELRLIDFDVAARRGARSAWEGQEDVRIGTLPYTAPEQILDPATATYEAADIYSLGVVLYEMLTGRIPFPMTDEEDEEEYRARLPFADPVPPTVYRPDLFPEIEAVLLKAMRRDPAARHASVAELRAELEAAFSAAGAGDTPEPRADASRAVMSILLIVPLVSIAAWLFLSS
ncbi:serine/threonine-protein kinase [Longimicrobium sp.]|uniref:serine/threonine-protein kinase n=1 Tax=Longimicrobium sp. TaxID=2029185 RepID=UPI003B3AD31D